MKKNIIKLNESCIKNIIKMSLMEMMGENYPAGADEDPSAPWHDNGDEYDEDENILYRINEYFDYDGFVVIDDTGTEKGQFETFQEAKDFCTKNANPETDQFAIYGVFDGYSVEDLDGRMGYDYIWDSDNGFSSYGQKILKSKYYGQMLLNKKPKSAPAQKLTESKMKRMIAESIKGVLKERTNEFAPLISEDIEALKKIYEKWQYAKYKPEGIDNFIDAILEAKSILEEMLPETPDMNSNEDW